MIKIITSSPPSLPKNKNQLISDVTALSASILLHATCLLGFDPPLVLRRISPLKIPAIPLSTISDSAVVFPRMLDHGFGELVEDETLIVQLGGLAQLEILSDGLD